MDYASSISTQRFQELKAPSPVDYLLILTVLLLVGFGLVMVYSTTGIVSQERMGDAVFFAKRQTLSAVLGLGMMLVCMRFPLNLLRKVSPYLFALSIFLLALPLMPGIADRAGGASRWVKFGPIRFQPAEFVKVCMVVFMAGFFARHESRITSFFHGIIKPFGLVAMAAALLLLQPDFGSSAVIIVVVLAMALASGVRLSHMIFCSVVVAVIMGLLVAISPYRMMRVVSFLSPFADASGKGYQLIQSLIAVGTGQVWGVGLGGSQQKLFFLPAAHTDFIFAVISEELGFVGGLVIILAFLVILWRGLLLAKSVRGDTFLFALAVGLTMMIVAPALLNIGVVIGVLPTKGMVLPLVGYGGSSLMACMAVVGLLIGIKREANSTQIPSH
ncbi:MAG: putative lipid II flippase FtsW [Pseudomonadota bacterium]|jgi:cell division protein FtsW